MAIDFTDEQAKFKRKFVAELIAGGISRSDAEIAFDLAFHANSEAQLAMVRVMKAAPSNEIKLLAGVIATKMLLVTMQGTTDMLKEHFNHAS